MTANADIRIRILGGIRAALEADTVADAMDRLGDQNDQAARAAVRLTAALKWMGRQLRRTARDGTLASFGMGLFTSAMSVAKLVALGLATLALPALAIALWHVAVAAGTVAVAFIGGMVAITAAAGLMAVGVIDRFKQMSEVVGTAANDLRNAAYSVRGAFRDAMATGADALMSSLARGLERITPLLRSLEPVFTKFGEHAGKMLETVFGKLVELGPEIREMFWALLPVVDSVGRLLRSFLGYFVQVATVGAPLLADAFDRLSKKLQGWTEAFTGERLKGALTTLQAFGAGVEAIWDAFAAPIKPFFADAMSEFGVAWKSLGPSIGTVLGSIVAGFMKLGRFALPYVTKGMAWLADRMPAIIGWLEKAGGAVVGALTDAWPFISNVVWPLLKGIAKSIGATLGIAFKVIGWVAKALGWVGDKLKPLKGAFDVIGQVIGFVFGPQIIGGIAKVIAKIGGVGGRGGVVFRFLGGLIGGVAKAVAKLAESIGKVAGFIYSKLGKALTQIRGPLTKAQELFAKFGAGIAATLANNFKSTINWIVDKLNWLIRAYGNTAGKLPGAPDIGEITPIGGSPAGQIAGSMLPPASTLFPSVAGRGAAAPRQRRGAAAAPASRSGEPRVTRHQTIVQVGARQIAEAISEWTDGQTALEG